MALKIIPAAATLFVIAAGPALAQSMFEQMPTIPGEAPAGGPPAAAAAPTMPAMPAAAGAPPMGVPPAQSIAPQQGGADCNGIQKTLEDRKNLVMKINAGSKSAQKLTAQQACTLFGQLQANGTAGMKWITSNKEWCAIPESFAEGFKADHAKVNGIRTKICGMAAQASKMEAQAREGGGGGGGLLGGPGLSGSFKLPQGAL